MGLFGSASIHFYGEGGTSYGRHGKAKNHRPDLKQVAAFATRRVLLFGKVIAISARPQRSVASELRNRLHAMIRADPVDGWIAAARENELAAFACRIASDDVAVRAKISVPRLNGQAEGQIAKLKLVKRQMCGRAKFNSFRARLVGKTRILAGQYCAKP